MTKQSIIAGAIGGLVLLAGAGCVPQTPPKEAGLEASAVPEKQMVAAPLSASIDVSDQVVTKNQVIIAKAITTAPSWVVIHLVEQGKPGKIIGQNLLSAGENQLFNVTLSVSPTAPQLIAMLHRDSGEVGVFEETSDSPVMDSAGEIVMTKFNVLKPLPETANPNAPAGDKSMALPPGQEKKSVEAKPTEDNKKIFSLTAKQWEFIPSAITVNKGDTVKLKITSTDVAHGFALPDFKIKLDLEPGATKEVEFVADKAGTFSFRCSVFCGDNHSGMKGTLIVK